MSPLTTAAPAATLSTQSLLTLIQQSLLNEDWRLRQAAVPLLLYLQAADQFNQLLTAAVNDPHPAVRAAAIKAGLGLIALPANFLTTVLADSDPENRTQAMRLLLKLTPEEREPWLGKILSDSDRVNKVAVTDLFPQLETREQVIIIDALEEAGTQDLALRQILLKNLAHAGLRSIQSHKIINNLLQGETPLVDIAILLDECSYLPANQCRLVLQKALQSEELAIRFRAAQEVGKFAGREPELAKPFYALLLQDKDLNTHLTQDSQLKPTPKDARIGLLAEQTEERETTLTWAISQGLGTLPPVIAVPMIKRILRESTDPALRQAAVINLDGLPWETIVTLLEIAFKDTDENVRLAAVEQTSRLPINQALPLLGLAFQDRSLGVRERAMANLGTNYLDVNLPLFARALQDTYPSVRAKAAEFYHRFPVAFIEQNLPTTLSDMNQKVALAASKSIPRLPEPLATKFLAHYQNDANASVRAGIASSLALLSWPQTFGLLKQYVDDEQEQVRIAALGSLATFSRQLGLKPIEVSQLLELLKKALHSSAAGVLLAAVQACTTLPLDIKIALLSPLFNPRNTYLSLAILESLRGPDKN